MPYLFVDIETVPDLTADEYFDLRQQVDSGAISKDTGNRDLFWKFKNGALNPLDGRVSMITYSVGGSHTFRLKEWELGERETLLRFYRLLGDLLRGTGETCTIVGHNVLSFDLLFLHGRMRHHGIDDDKWLYQRVFRGPVIIDLLQLHLPLNGYRLRGLKHDVLAHAYGFQVKSSTGAGAIEHYFQGDYDSVLQYSEREFIYPDMFAKIQRDGLVTREQLQGSIEHYNLEHGLT